MLMAIIITGVAEEVALAVRLLVVTVVMVVLAVVAVLVLKMEVVVLGEVQQLMLVQLLLVTQMVDTLVQTLAEAGVVEATETSTEEMVGLVV